MDDARVVCRQLGYTDAIWYKSYAAYGQGSGRIWMDDVTCRGYESALRYCNFNDWGQNNCQHSEDAGAGCNGE